MANIQAAAATAFATEGEAMTKFRPADVACLLSASNRRADIVRATPQAGVAQWQSRRFVSVRQKVRFRSVSTRIRSIAESRREGYDTFRLADAKQQAFTQRPFVGLSPKQPVSARVAPGLRTMSQRKLALSLGPYSQAARLATGRQASAVSIAPSPMGSRSSYEVPSERRAG